MKARAHSNSNGPVQNLVSKSGSSASCLQSARHVASKAGSSECSLNQGHGLRISVTGSPAMSVMTIMTPRSSAASSMSGSASWTDRSSALRAGAALAARSPGASSRAAICSAGNRHCRPIFIAGNRPLSAIR